MWSTGDGASTTSINSIDIKEGAADATLLGTMGEGKIKRLKRTKSRHAITLKTILLKLAHTHGKDLFTLNIANAINTFRSSRRLIFQIRPAAGTSRHKRSIWCKVWMPCCIVALLCP